ncbi:MAG: class I SAM-dependent methyltransferase [Myxococcota bacterium]|nr:class I SAM-dependent methyltransferase [Myxococcota bacterium]
MDRFDFFQGLPRGEPGGVTFTAAYVGSVPIGPDDVVLDLHSRCGERAVWLARSRRCKVVAVDQDRRFVEALSTRAADGGAGDQVEPVVSTYDDLSFEPESFRLVIAEWAPIFTGLRNGLTRWKNLVPVDGYVAFSYPGIINKDAPKEVRGPYEERMVEPMQTLAEYHNVARAVGYEIVLQSPLPHELWELYYSDVLRRAWALNGGRNQQSASPLVRSLLEEAQWYRRIGRGRVFLQSMLLRRTA